MLVRVLVLRTRTLDTFVGGKYRSDTEYYSVAFGRGEGGRGEGGEAKQKRGMVAAEPTDVLFLRSAQGLLSGIRRDD